MIHLSPTDWKIIALAVEDLQSSLLEELDTPAWCPPRDAVEQAQMQREYQRLTRIITAARQRSTKIGVT